MLGNAREYDELLDPLRAQRRHQHAVVEPGSDQDLGVDPAQAGPDRRAARVVLVEQEGRVVRGQESLIPD